MKRMVMIGLGILAISLVENLAHAKASPLIWKSLLENKAQQLAEQMQKTQRPFNENCTNLSGEWEGSCESSEGISSVTIQITQDECKSIKINDDEPIKIGVHETNNNNMIASVSSATAMDWENANTLVGTGVFHMHLINKSIAGMIYSKAITDGVELNYSAVLELGNPDNQETIKTSCNFKKHGL